MPDSHASLNDHLEQLLHVEKFPPPAGFAAAAQVSDPAVYEQAAADPVAWWATQARERLHWDTPFSSALDDSNPRRCGTAPIVTWASAGSAPSLPTEQAGTWPARSLSATQRPYHRPVLRKSCARRSVGPRGKWSPGQVTTGPAAVAAAGPS